MRQILENTSLRNSVSDDFHVSVKRMEVVELRK